MIIIDDNTRINSDSSQFIIEVRNVTKTGENKGKETWVSQSFHPSISLLLHKLIEMNIFKIAKKKDMDLETFITYVEKELKLFDKLIKLCAERNAEVLTKK